MKLIRSLFFVFALVLTAGTLFAQIKTYEAQWKKVDELILKKNLPQSALAEVKKIYQLAKKENQEAQVIKALVYMTELQQQTREENTIAAIKEIEKEITTAKEPSASILKSLLADRYLQYLQSNRWKFYNRSHTVNFNKADIATWTLEDLHQKIGSLYLASIENEAVLKQTRLERYEAIITKGNLRYLRPTLYDLLAHTALGYFQNDERDIRKPAYAFEIRQREAFAPAAEFARFRFETKDSLSLQHKALLIFQNLLSFHLNDAKPDALIDADILRLQFVYDNAVAEEKDSLYKKALENLVGKYKAHPAAKQAGYLLAYWYEQNAQRYKPHGDTSFRFYRVMARDILREIVRDSAVKNQGWVGSHQLLQQIEKPSFSFVLEKVNLPRQPFRALVNYKNLETLHFRLIKLDAALQKQLDDQDDNNKFWSILARSTPVRAWKQELPATNDLQEHSAEIGIEGLAPGEYYLFASPDEVYKNKTSMAGARKFYVSPISYVSQGNHFFVLHRETGLPLVNASVEVFKYQYNYKASKYQKIVVGNYRTDINGYFELKRNKDQRYEPLLLHITHENESLQFDEAQYDYYYYTDYTEGGNEDARPRIFYFTDRSIYRPGQTVYFKGIAVNKTGKAGSIAANYKTTVYLYDANFQVRDSLTLTTNGYGSFNGKFQLPQRVLNGNFRIKDQTNSETYFSVEEYKRPKFEVVFEKISESYQVHDTITIIGNAKAYAGNMVGGAKVSYRVVRRPRLPYTWFWRSWLPPTPEMEIAHGETTTDPGGKFSIRFTAIPDKSIDIKFQPLFDYQVYADVTDINGETRSGEQVVTAGYTSLILLAEIPSRIRIDSFKTIRLHTENMSGVFQPSLVTLSYKKLEPEQRLIRRRYWNRPDQFVMTKEAYIRLFPHDEYDNESDPHSWPRSSSFTQQDSTRENGIWTVATQQLKPGYYEIEILTKDRDGKEIRDRHVVELYDPNDAGFNKPEYLWTIPSRIIEPGQNTTVQIGSSASNVFLIAQTDKPGDKAYTEIPIGKKDKQPVPQPEINEDQTGFGFTTLNRERKNFTYSATEADRGGYGLSYFFVKDNRMYQFQDIITVPWSNKELKIEYASFRDKTLPGNEETWKVKISGSKNEKLAAEMLVSMYDASLDQFKYHGWDKPGIWGSYGKQLVWSDQLNFTDVESDHKWLDETHRPYPDFSYDELAFDVHRFTYYRELKATSAMRTRRENGEVVYSFSKAAPSRAIPESQSNGMFDTNLDTTTTHGDGVDDEFDNDQPPRPDREPAAVQIRKNFNETAFFFPELKTNANGHIEFSFTTPEALTRWKLQTLAHTKELAFGLSKKEMVTQKELMVQPNMPRFLRQGDRLELVVKIVNLSDKEITGQTELELFDASTNTSVDGWFMNSFPNQYFTVAAGQSEAVRFPIQVPHQFNKALVWRVVARAGNVSDGEENLMPVLTNRVLVTETLPLPVKGNGTKTFTFEKLLQSGDSETLQHQSLKVEYTSNPAWYAVQALPFLMEYPYECAEQIWNRYYANALAGRIANSSPRIKQIFEQWKTIDTAALLSNLQKNPELKSALLEETPWVLQAKTEEEQKKNIALLFDMVRMASEMETSLAKLMDMQSSNGGFVWFKGGPDDRYITQYIVTGIGHLKKLGVETTSLHTILNKALPYLDKKIKEDYDNLVKRKAKLDVQQIGQIEIQYLYMRSFFPEQPIPAASRTAVNYFSKQSYQFWMKQNKCLQGMIALTAHRSANKQLAAAILQSLKETSILHEELGRYWLDQRFGFSWHWSYAPIETQALMIEVFSEAGQETKTVDELRTWLIKNKQTNNWRTTRATADACYAMLLQGTDWLAEEPVVRVQLGSTVITNQDQKTEAGTGYFQQSVNPGMIKPKMGQISVSVEQKQNNSASWGAVYWQYFEEMDKITTAATPLQLVKKLFIEKNTDRGPVLAPVEEGTTLQVGDKIRVRIELRVDRDMEYVHMKDMRASALEPVNVLSGYKWQGGLGYYESTRDASTNFFFSLLRKGTYVFEYPLFVTHTGNFTNGITTIQCMYAPEFTAHSEGVRISVE